MVNRRIEEMVVLVTEKRFGLLLRRSTAPLPLPPSQQQCNGAGSKCVTGSKETKPFCRVRWALKNGAAASSNWVILSITFFYFPFFFSISYLI